MSKNNKVILFDVSALTPEGIEKFQKRVDMGASISDVKLDQKTLRTSHIIAYMDTDIDIELLINGFNVKYTDISGTNLLNLNL